MSASLSLRSKLYLLTVLPLVVVITAVSLLSVNQARELGRREIDTFRTEILRIRRQELKHYVELALSAIAQQRRQGGPAAKLRAENMLRKLSYGPDGYFFVYNYQGVNIVHPKLPQLQGHNLINYRDQNGDFVIRKLLAAARAGGGYHRYLWYKPSKGKAEPKLGYAVGLSDWHWMLGTGLYVDDIDDRVSAIEGKIEENIDRTLLWLGLLMGTALIVITGGALTINISESRLADNRLKVLSQRTVQFEENEKRRLSRELHDGINQLLASAKFRLEAAGEHVGKDTAAARQQMDKAIATLISAIHEVRRISHRMRPTVLDDLGLHAALDGICAEFSATTGIEVDIVYQGNTKRLSADVETALYRCVQEALANVERHADAGHVTLTLKRTAAWVTLCVQDDGRGFRVDEVLNANGPGEGIGLRNMRERIEFLTGRFRARSTPGVGTLIVARVPAAGLRTG